MKIWVVIDMKGMVRTFCDIDPRLKKGIEKRSITRIKITGIEYDEETNKGELQYEQIYSRIGKFLEGKSSETIWFERMKQVEKYIEENDKIPAQSSKIKYDKSLGEWVQKQKYNYKIKYGMAGVELRHEWEKFVEKYSEYFKTNREKMA